MNVQVSLPYTDLIDSEIAYNDVHIWCIENFGLPGDRYLYQTILTNHMTYIFTDEKDAVLFNLRWGGKIKNLTTEVV